MDAFHTFKATFNSKKTDNFGVLSMNYESLITAGGKEKIDWMFETYPRIYLVIDESQKVKNPKAGRTKEVNKIAQRSSFRRALSGTPILRGLEDLFSQYYILRPGITGRFATDRLWTNWSALRNWFCVTRPVPGARLSGAKIIVGYKNEEEFREKIRPYTTRVTSDMFSDSEEPIFMNIECPMTAKQATAYAQMKAMLIAQMDDGVITAQNALVQLAKLSQIASGFVLDADRNVEWFSTSKIDACATLLESLDEPVIVWAPYIALKQRMYEELTKTVGGELKYKFPVTLFESADDVDVWKKKGGVLIGNQASGLGVGMNLQLAAANIYMANTFSAEARWQSEKRTDRIGQTRAVRYWDLVAPGTVDETVKENLQGKADIASKNIDGLRDMLL